MKKGSGKWILISFVTLAILANIFWAFDYFYWK